MKKLLSIALALAMAFSLAACAAAPAENDPGAPQETAGAAPAGNEAAQEGERVLRIAQNGAPTTLGMLRADGYATAITQNISDSLVRINDEFQLEPGLATSWEWIDENTWQFKLREGVTFTNGEPFNAEAAAYNLNSLLDRELSYRWSSHWDPAWPITVTAVDEYTINIETAEPSAFVPNLLTRIVLYAPEQWQAEGDDEYFTHPVGVGPYEVESWDIGISLTLKKSDMPYWDGSEAYFDKVVIDCVTSDAARISSLQAGEYDIVEEIPYDQVARLQAEGGDAYRIDIFETVGLNWLYFNGYTSLDNWVWNNDFRKAIAHAIDGETISQTLFGGICKVRQGVAPDIAIGGDAGTTALAYDPELSKQILADIGYDGTTLRFCIAEGEFSNDVSTAEFIAASLQAVGINVELQQVDKAILDDERKAGNIELCMINTPGSFGGMSDYYWLQMESKRGYINGEEFAQVAEMYRAAVAYGLTDQEREDALRAANAALWELTPVLWSVGSNMTLGVRNGLQGVRYAPNSWLYFKNAYYS